MTTRLSIAAELLAAVADRLDPAALAEVVATVARELCDQEARTPAPARTVRAPVRRKPAARTKPAQRDGPGVDDQIAMLLATATTPMTASAIAQALGFKAGVVNLALGRLSRRSPPRAERVGNGRYKATAHSADGAESARLNALGVEE